jgi:hypothetical protein
MEYHLDVIRDRASEAYAQTVEATTRIQAFGTPTGNILQMITQMAGSGIPLSIYPHHLGGFTRMPED